MAKHYRTKNTIKIADLKQELKLTDDRFRHLLREVRINVDEGQKNLDQNEAGRLRQYLNEQRRREELRRQTISLPPIISVQDLATKLELPVGDILSTLLKNGVLATINHDVDYETAAIIATDLGYNTEESVAELEADILTPEKLEEILKKESPAEQVPRPAVVTIMGHVDHGKTTLLDALRQSNVAASEAGGITQAISSYQVKHGDRLITFIDTPGHATFEFMRQRGASLADIAILVVAADDGVKPQTKEAIAHARAANLPIIVAITKVDKPTANLEKTKTELSKHDLIPEEWGGKTVMVPVSSVQKTGLSDLLEMINLTTDLDPPRANPHRPALGSVIESRLNRSLGPLAALLIHTGTLKLGDHVTIGRTVGRIRRLLDFNGRSVSSAGPSMPVTIVGLSDVPQAGDIMQVVEAQEEARSKAGQGRSTVKTLNKAHEGNEQPTFPLVLKADSQGSLEAIKQTITSMIPPELRLSLVRAEVGYVSDSDVLTAEAAGAIIYAFNTKPAGMAGKLAEKEHVSLRLFNIIYQLAEDVREEIEKRLPVDIVQHERGRLKVLKVFFSAPSHKIIGGEIAAGWLGTGHTVEIYRQKEIIGRGQIKEMQREKKVLERAQVGDQVGLTIEGKGKIKDGDVVVAYEEERVKKRL
jgi:translation initiation factor IF-2